MDRVCSSEFRAFLRRTASSHVSDYFRTVRVTRNTTVVRDYRVHAIVIFRLSPEDTRSKRFLGNGNGYWKCKLGQFNCSVYIGRATTGYERRTRKAVVGALSSQSVCPTEEFRRCYRHARQFVAAAEQTPRKWNCNAIYRIRGTGNRYTLRVPPISISVFTGLSLPLSTYKSTVKVSAAIMLYTLSSLSLLLLLVLLS